MADEATITDAGDESTAASVTTEQSAESVDWQTKAESMQKVNADLERKLKRSDDNRGRVSELEAELAAIKAKAEGKEAEHSAALEAQRVKDDALAVANGRIRNAELRLAAKGQVNEDVLAVLPALLGDDVLSAIEVGADGQVDADALNQALSDLLTRMPSLAAQGKRFQGDADGGARKESGGVQQLNRADMARMTPEQIDAATRKGQFSDLLAGK